MLFAEFEANVKIQSELNEMPLSHTSHVLTFWCLQHSAQHGYHTECSTAQVIDSSNVSLLGNYLRTVIDYLL